MSVNVLGMREKSTHHSPVGVRWKSSDIVVNETGHFLKSRAHWRRHIVGVQKTHGDAVNELDDVPMTESINGLRHNEIRHVRSLYDPPVINILVRVACHLLLM